MAADQVVALVHGEVAWIGYARMGQRFAAAVFGVVPDTNRIQS